MTIHDFNARLGTGEERRLAHYRGNVLLIVNVASKCGFTSQYIGLQSLYEQFQPRGFEILGFPCDQFGHQEPATVAQLAASGELKVTGDAAACDRVLDLFDKFDAAS